jgi:hypothetical protein
MFITRHGSVADDLPLRVVWIGYGPPADRDLLFGILGLQMDLIARDALVTAMNA